MPVAFGSISNTTYAARTNTTVTAPASIANGDLLIAQLILVHTTVPADPTGIPSGWTQIGSYQTATAGGASAKIGIWYKIAASESGDYTWTHANAEWGTQGLIARYTGVSSGSPINASSSLAESPASTTRTATGVTTTVANCMALFIGWDWADTANALSPPSGMTERLEVNPLSYVAEVAVPSAGATGNKSHVCNSVSGFPRGAWLVALTPADQGITGSLFSDADTFPASTVANVAFSPSFGSVSSTTYVDRTNTTATAPAGISDGDLLLAQVFLLNSTDPGTSTPPAGWTQVGSTQTVADAFNTANIAIFRKVASSESGDYTWTHGFAASQVMIARYTGVDTNSPVNVSSSNTGSPANSTRTATGVTTTADNCLLAYVGWDWADNVNNETAPTNHTERLDNVLMFLSDEVQASQGASGNKTNTCNSNSGNPRGAWLVALAPSGSGVHNIAGSLFSDTDTFFAATRTSANTITASLFAETDQFFEASLLAGHIAQGVVFIEGDTYHSSTVSLGNDIAGALFTDTDTFHSAVVQSGELFVVAELFVESDTFGQSLIGGLYGVDPTLFADADTFYDSVVLNGNEVAGGLFSEADAFFASQLDMNLEGVPFADSDVFFGSSVSLSDIFSTHFPNYNYFHRALVLRDGIIFGSGGGLGGGRRRRR